MIIKHEFCNFKGIDSENIFNPYSLKNKGAEKARESEMVIARTARFCKYYILYDSYVIHICLVHLQFQ